LHEGLLHRRCDDCSKVIIVHVTVLSCSRSALASRCGRPGILPPLKHGYSQPQPQVAGRLRLPQRIPPPPLGMPRVFAVSDLHTDFDANDGCVAALGAGGVYAADTVLVAGDVSDKVCMAGCRQGVSSRSFCHGRVTAGGPIHQNTLQINGVLNFLPPMFNLILDC